MLTQLGELIGDVGHGGGVERWGASCDLDSGMGHLRLLWARWWEGVGYCVSSPVDVSEDPQKAELGQCDKRGNSHRDDPELESEDAAEVGVWKKEEW